MLEPKNKANVVTLCGSTRYMNEFRAAYERETLAGSVVISVGIVTAEDLKDHPEYRKVSTQEKHTLDRVHFRKIDISDEILVLNRDAYVGDSTAREIRYARMKGKGVRWLEPFPHSQVTGCYNCGYTYNGCGMGAWTLGKGSPCPHCGKRCDLPMGALTLLGREEFYRRWNAPFVDEKDNPVDFPPMYGTCEDRYAQALIKVDRLVESLKRAEENAKAADRQCTQINAEVEKARVTLKMAKEEWETHVRKSRT